MLPISNRNLSLSSLRPPQVQYIEMQTAPSAKLSERAIRALRRSEIILVDAADAAEFHASLTRRSLRGSTTRVQIIPEGEFKTHWLNAVAELENGPISRIITSTATGLRDELQYVELIRASLRYYPRIQTIRENMAHIRLPWYYQELLTEIKVLSNYRRTFGLTKLSRIIHTDATLAFDIEPEDLADLLEHLSFMSRDTRRALALVSQHPLKAPICWLTTLGEAHELISHWKCQGATTVYLEPDARALRQLLTTASSL